MPSCKKKYDKKIALDIGKIKKYIPTLWFPLTFNGSLLVYYWGNIKMQWFGCQAEQEPLPTSHGIIVPLVYIS